MTHPPLRPAGAVAIRIVGPKEFAPLVASAGHVYGAAMGRSAELVVQRQEIMYSHLDRRDFVAVVAEEPETAELVGFGYGYHGRPGEWWHDVVARAMARRARTWLRDAFEVAELHVTPTWHGMGIGRRILQTLLAHSHSATVMLSTHDRESPARALYRSVGFTDLLEGFYFPGSAERYVVMGLRR